MNTSLKTAAYRATIALIAGALPAIASAADFLPLGEGVLPSGKYVQDYKYTLYPGEGVPWHYHPGPVYVVVIGGTITEDEGCGKPLNTYTVGTAFSEAPRAIHQVFNHGPAGRQFTEDSHSRHV